MKIIPTHLLAVASIIAISILGCDQDAPAEDVKAATAAHDKAQEKGVDSGTRPEESPPGDEGSTLEDGSHGVFGLKMPRGMIPIPVPAKGTYRFEGTHQMTILRRYLLAQLETPLEPVDEGDRAVLIRQARVLEGGEEGGRIALRLFEGSLGGASVDVWKETAPFDPTAKARSMPTPDPWPSSHKGDDKDGVRIAPVPRTPTERRRQVWEMMEKVRRGEKLTPQDMENPYFN